jgi:hypothetical protein
MEQLSLFESNPVPHFTTRVKYDLYWDEITKSPDDELLMVVNEEMSPTTISNSPNDELLMVVENDQLLSTTISKRTLGNGTGRVTKRTISKNGKDYQQFWYDWQYYQNGKLIGRSRYIPKRLLPQILLLEQEKVPVSKIIEVLGVRG